ncbi:MAG: toxin-activating lysine-acyltransferase [Hyphomicrobiaceae bacterium]
MAEPDVTETDVDATTSELDSRPVRPTGISKEQQELMQSRLLAANFGNLVTVMMQSQHHKHVPLSELHKRLVPPLVNNQFRVAEVRKEGSGSTIPVALIIWAQVSDEVHARLTEKVAETIDLAPKDWKSGDNYWIIDVVGPQRFLAPLLTGLRKGEFKDKTVYFRVRSENGPEVRTLGQAENAAAPAAETKAEVGEDQSDTMNGAAPAVH